MIAFSGPAGRQLRDKFMLRLLPFAIAIAVVIGAGATATALASEVRGKVLMGPMCPGPARVGVECPSKPFATTVDVFAFRGDGSMPATPVASAATDTLGNFQLPLAPGRYLLLPRPPKPGGLASSKPVEVTVAATGVTTVTLRVDTGMR